VTTPIDLWPFLVNVTVSDGNVRLWGMVGNADQAAAAESAAKTLPGVK
jgi:osmotically-inducible protein OsmY